MDPIWLAFLTGITTGGISCLAVQGGLLTSVLTQKEKGQKDSFYVGIFLLAKLFSYTLLGFGLGLIGASLQITPQMQGVLQIIAGIFMIVTALRLLDVHPIFRRFVIQPPKSTFKFLRKQTKLNIFFAPLMLGFLTVLIPCGVTQGMMILALSTSNPLMAAGIMFGFTLGTSPLFFVLGLTAAKFMNKKGFLYISALAIFILGILSINTGQTLRGSVHTIQNYWNVITQINDKKQDTQVLAQINKEGKQEAIIKVNTFGYESNVKTLKVGVPVQLKLITQNTQGCSRSFTIPSLNISKILPEDGTETIEFTPKKKGYLSYTCSMGMFTGAFKVI